MSDKIKAIQDSQRPETKTQLRSVLGLNGFYRKFIPNFACIALPLTDLTKQGCPTKLEWENCHEIAFRTFKSSLINSPILKQPNMKESFILPRYASDRRLGALLLQCVGDQKLLVAYAS